MPLSATAIFTRPLPLTPMRTVMRLSQPRAFAQAYLALRMRLTRICSTLCLSTRTSGTVVEFAHDLDAVPVEGRAVHSQRVLDQIGGRQRLR